MKIPQRIRRIRLKLLAWRGIQVICWGIILFTALDLFCPLNAQRDYAPLIKAKDGTVLHAFLTRDQQWRFETKLSEITPELKEAIVFKEDRHFYHHPGINPLAVVRAVWNNVLHLRRTSGASTITMQVTRLLQPKKRSYGNKLIEMFRALQLEAHYSKDEILQLYLNLVPYGSNIQGVKAASLLYFNKSPDQLSLAELTALSIIPNKPNALVMGKDNERIIAERNKWLQRFSEAHLFKRSVIEDALREPLTARRLSAPDLAPQLSWRLRFAYPASGEIASTIDGAMQLKAEDIVQRYSAMLKLQGVYNASVLVADNRTGQVCAYIGSPDFGDRVHQGQVDGVRAMRSPGSTLKPFLYGLAFDAGIATPQAVLNDVPINLSGYTPENYDLQFRGKVSVEEALRQSLNIPAVKTLQLLGVNTFAQHLGEAGFFSVWQQRKKVGLSMILGGCTVRLQELVGLFSAFANGGVARPLIFTQSDSARHSEGLRILSPEADYMVCRILTEITRPDLPNGYDGARGIPKIAWKTGTSYGRKDAWSVGFNGHYTIGVWLGNFDGRGVTALSGAATATPLLFELFNAIDKDAEGEWLRAPRNLATRFVCKETGKLPGDSCTQQVMDYYIPGISRTESCDHLRQVWVSADAAFSYCTSCLPVAGYATKTYPNLAPEMAAWYEQQGIAYRKTPPHNPSCSRLFDGQKPTITTLQNGMTYLIVDKAQQLQLGCTGASDVQKVYWYVNDKFLSAAALNEKIFFAPEAGRVKISCTDDKGRVADIEVLVKRM